MTRSVSQSVPSQPQQPPGTGLWSDLASLQGSTGTSTLPLQYVSPTTSSSLLSPGSTSPFSINPASGTSTLGTSFTTGVSPSLGLVSHSPGLGVSASSTTNISGSGATTQAFQPSFALGTSTVNPFAQMLAQQSWQAQVQPNHFLSTPPYGTLPSQYTSFPPQVQVPQIQQPAFSQPGTNPFFNAAAQPQHMLTPQPSPISFMGSPQQPTSSPFQQQPSFQQGAQAPFQPQPAQFGNMQPGVATGAATGNPFTSWLTQQPNSYASAHVGQGSSQWGVM